MTDPVPFVDLKAQFATVKDEVMTAVEGVFDTQSFILGETVRSFETAFGERLGLEPDRVIGVSSGTDALLASLMALGVGPGDRVLTTAFSFFATAGVVSRLHATPEFVDVDPVTMNMNPALLEGVDPNRYKAVIVVHLFGRVADMDAIRRWAGDTPVIEDACQAIGAVTDDGPAGTLGEMGCFSFFPTKNLGGAGDGGCITVPDGELAERVRLLRTHGAPVAYRNRIIGGNFRLDALQAAVLEVKLRHLDEWNRQRRTNAEAYDEFFRHDGLDSVIDVPPLDDSHSFVAHQYVILVPRRDELRAALEAEGIGTAVYYPVPLPYLDAFAALGHGQGEFPEAERAAGSVLALPIFPELGEDRVRRVAHAIARFFE